MTYYIGNKKVDNFRTSVSFVAYLLSIPLLPCLRFLSFMTFLLFIPHLLRLYLPFSMAYLIYFYIVSLNQGHLH